MAPKAAAAAQVEPYTKLPNRILRGEDEALKSLKPAVRLLYNILISYSWKEPRFFVSQPRLARDCNASIRSIRRWTKILEAAGLLRVHFHNGLIHRYELLGNYKVNPGQPNRLPQEPPRTTRQYEPRNPGQTVSHQLPLNELLSKETKKEGGTPDPWARFRSDPLVVKAAQAGTQRKK
jgi:hypothetical protein